MAMARTIQTEMDLLQAADDLVAWSKELLQEAPLTENQRTDLQAVSDAAQNFRTLANQKIETIKHSTDEAELQILRHELRNHLNIIVGFSRIILRDLPDNLLLHLITVRDIQGTGRALLNHVNNMG